MSAHSRAQGKHGAASRDSATARGLSHEAIKLLKTQDAGYLRTTGEKVRREMEKMEREVRLQEGMREVMGEGHGGKREQGRRQRQDEDEMMDIGEDGFGFDFGDEEKDAKPRKLVFADDRQEQRELKKRKLDEEAEDGHYDEDEDVDSLEQQQKQKKSRKQLEAERQTFVEQRRARKIRKRATEARENKLKALKQQYTDISAAERELDWQRGRMDNSVGGTNKNGIKWKIRERKK